MRGDDSLRLGPASARLCLGPDPAAAAHPIVLYPAKKTGNQSSYLAVNIVLVLILVELILLLLLLLLLATTAVLYPAKETRN